MKNNICLLFTSVVLASTCLCYADDCDDYMSEKLSALNDKSDRAVTDLEAAQELIDANRRLKKNEITEAQAKLVKALAIRSYTNSSIFGTKFRSPAAKAASICANKTLENIDESTEKTLTKLIIEKKRILASEDRSIRDDRRKKYQGISRKLVSQGTDNIPSGTGVNASARKKTTPNMPGLEDGANVQAAAQADLFNKAVSGGIGQHCLATSNQNQLAMPPPQTEEPPEGNETPDKLSFSEKWERSKIISAKLLKIENSEKCRKKLTPENTKTLEELKQAQVKLESTIDRIFTNAKNEKEKGNNVGAIKKLHLAKGNLELYQKKYSSRAKILREAQCLKPTDDLNSSN